MAKYQFGALANNILNYGAISPLRLDLFADQKKLDERVPHGNTE